jgi:hypothetical protein
LQESLRFVDVGGGEGKLLWKILELNPEMVGAVLDMPRTIETVNQKLNSTATHAEDDARTSLEISSIRFQWEPTPTFCAG